jgi:hypothetical protein
MQIIHTGLIWRGNLFATASDRERPGMPPQLRPPYQVSPQLLAREDFKVACFERNFGEVFRLMRKYDGASQDRLASLVDCSAARDRTSDFFWK